MLNELSDESLERIDTIAQKQGWEEVSLCVRDLRQIRVLDGSDA